MELLESLHVHRHDCSRMLLLSNKLTVAQLCVKYSPGNVMANFGLKTYCIFQSQSPDISIYSTCMTVAFVNVGGYG